ncbi:spatacsin isoform 4-T4 [Molossus nigricans]
MAAEKWCGSAAAGGGDWGTRTVERVLPMLLVPVPAEATGRLGTRAQLHREQEVLGSLTAAGSLQVLSLRPGGRGAGGCSLDGPFRHFVWEDSHNSCTPTDKPRLLALSENHELLICEFNLKDGRCDGAILYNYSKDILQKLIEDQSISISLLSLRILSFHNNTSLLFINKCIVLHIMFPERDAEIRVLNCFTLPLPAQAVDSIIDAQLCKGIFFVLSSLGWIYIFDIVDGTHVAHVDLALHQEDICNEQQQEPAKISSFTSLKVSQDLDVVVIVSSSNSAIALNLNLYFRQHPRHLFHEKTLEDIPIEGAKGIDEDDPVNSDYNMKLTKFSFQVDRSWKAQLLSLNETIKSSKLEVSHCAPWFKDILHVESPESNNHCTSVPGWAFIPQDVMHSQYNFPQKDLAKTSDPGRAWKIMHISEQKEPIELRCVSVTGFTALFAWTVERTGYTIVLWDLETEGMQCFSIGKKCIPIDSSGDRQLCLVMTENGLSLIFFGLTQEEFLNRLMIHGSASTVDSLCHLNGWGRCSIPIHALEAGIENRQLDTVDFFLKSKENLLNLSPKSSVPDQFDHFPSQLYLRNVEELTPALDLLCSAIRESDSETQSKNFSEQLLNLTLSFLNKQIKELFIHNEELDEHLQKGVNILTSYINELRTFMFKFPWKLTDTVDEYDVNENIPKVMESNMWEKLSIEEVIASAILNNKIPEAQTFFRINSHSAQRLEELIKIGLDLVFDSLKKNNVKKASELLKNMGFDVKDQLLKICFYTTDKNIRDFLVEILKEKNYFSEKEKRTIDFVHQVEKFYSEHLQENMQIQSFPRYWIKEQDFFKHKSVLDSFLKYDHKDKFNKQNHRISLNWAQWWNQLTQESIILPRINPEEYKSYSPEALWRYLTARHDWLSIISWIGEFQTHNSYSSLQQNKWPPLTVDVIDQSTCCNNNMRNKILDELARKEIFLISELEDFELFLLRLNRIGGVMQDTLPVQNYRSKEELLGLDSLKLRVDMRVANIILSYRCTNEDAQYSFIRESLAEKLSKLAVGEKATIEELLVLLEEGIWSSIQQQEIKRLSSESSSQWALVVQFCRLHNMKLSTSYLRECAKADDWLQFIIHSQLHNYHPEEVKSLLQYFSPVLQDHLRLAFENLPSVSNSRMDSDQGCNKFLQERQKNKEEITDFFEILLRCSEEPNSWCWLLAEAVKQQAPILSVLASCLQDASAIPCLCVWIITSVEDNIAAEAMGHIQDSIEGHTWDLEDLSVIWRTLLTRQKSKTLIRGFQLFFKDSPLLLMMEMYELCMFFKNYKEAEAKLLEFQKSLETLETAALKVHSVIPVPWLKEQVWFFLKLMLQQCRTQYELGKLLQLFVGIEHLFPDGPDVKKLCVLSQILKDTSIAIDHIISTNYSLENFQHECRSILEKLETNGQFASARRVAELAELPVDNLVIEEITQEMQTLKHIDQWSLKQARIDFWKKCHENFKKNSISSKAASSFFSAQAHVSCEYPTEERHLLLTLAGHWLAQEDLVLVEELEELEKQIWLCRITQHTLRGNQEEIDPRCSQQISTSGELSFDSLASEFSFSKLAALNTSKYLELNGLPSKETCENRLDWKEQESLNFLIGRLLDDGCVHEASRVCRYFHFYNQDVALALHCRALASGEVGVDGLHPEIRAFLQSAELLEEEKEPRIPLRKVPSTSSLDSQSFVMLPPNDEVVTNLETLTSKCLHGKNYCRRVLCLYELSKELGCSYTDVATQDGEAVLQAILASQQPDRCRRAQAFISTQGLEPDKVAELVAEEVTRELLSPSEGAGHKQMVTPAEESQTFLQLTTLCPDRTLIGMKLLEKISSIPHGELSCTTELLILAHHCFTLTCHMEGIIRVLQAARLLTDNHLAPNEEYGLVVRLLTGIGRYNEMTYIFELLHKKHYFEVLMRKKLDPTGTLKTALLDYIKRCRPGDSEKHNMIALCFSMCREIGENHEAAAYIQLKLIESQPWEDRLKDGHQLKQLLLKALTLMLDAAESYTKDSCVRQALHCHRLTKLLTLQIHFLNTGQNIMLINLGRHRLMDCIMSLPRFYQASIVAEAYDFVPDWAEILYQQVILKGDFHYLEEFKQQKLLRTSIFEEISKKYKHHQPTDAAVKNLKKLFTYCEDIYLYYKLAYEHKFYDTVNMLLKDPQTGCCLKDMLAG